MRSSTGASFYYTADALGSIILLTDSAQAKAATYGYVSWGQATSTTGTQAAVNPWKKANEHQHTRVLLSTPGFGPVLAAEFLGATGGDLTAFQSANRFAGVVGLAPAPRDSGRISGNHHRPRRYVIAGSYGLLPLIPIGTDELLRIAELLRPQNESKVKATSRRCSPWPDEASMSSAS